MELVPPPLPDVPRVPRMPLWRWVGILLVATIPVLAAADVFGNVEGAEEVPLGALTVEVRWPKRFRLQERGEVAVLVHNPGPAASEPVTVELDAGWVERHEGVAFTPAPRAPWTFALGPVPPGETARLIGEVRAHRAGRHAGDVRLRAGSERAQVPIDTVVWP